MKRLKITVKRKSDKQFWAEHKLYFPFAQMFASANIFILLRLFYIILVTNVSLSAGSAHCKQKVSHRSYACSCCVTNKGHVHRYTQNVTCTGLHKMSRAQVYTNGLATLLGVCEKLRKATVSCSCPSIWVCVYLSVCPSARNKSAATGRIFMKFSMWVFCQKSLQTIPVPIKYDKNKGYFSWRPLYIHPNIALSSS